MRFFGKFLGTHADYYVFETSLKTPPEEPELQLGKGQRTAQHSSAAQHVSAATRPSTVSPAHSAQQISTSLGSARMQGLHKQQGLNQLWQLPAAHNRALHAQPDLPMGMP